MAVGFGTRKHQTLWHGWLGVHVQKLRLLLPLTQEAGVLHLS